MNKEDYVSLEVAKLLKEKGYDEECYSAYDKQGRIGKYITPINWNREYSWALSRPTLYETAKWLRSQGIFIEIIPHYSRKYDVIEYEYRISTYFDLLEKNRKRIKSKEYYEKYEQCLNGAILESLKLI